MFFASKKLLSFTKSHLLILDFSAHANSVLNVFFVWRHIVQPAVAGIYTLGFEMIVILGADIESCLCWVGVPFIGL